VPALLTPAVELAPPLFSVPPTIGAPPPPPGCPFPPTPLPLAPPVVAPLLLLPPLPLMALLPPAAAPSGLPVDEQATSHTDISKGASQRDETEPRKLVILLNLRRAA